jgi:hypothetical protein
MFYQCCINCNYLTLFFWAQMALASLVPFQGPKKSRFSGPIPSNTPRNDVALLKTITYRAIKTTGTLVVNITQLGQDGYLSQAKTSCWPYPIPTRVSGPLLIFRWVGGIWADGPPLLISHNLDRIGTLPKPTRVADPLPCQHECRAPCWSLGGWGEYGRMPDGHHYLFLFSHRWAVSSPGGREFSLDAYAHCKKFVMFCKHCEIKLLKILFVVHRMAALKNFGFPSFSESKIFILFLTVYI